MSTVDPIGSLSTAAPPPSSASPSTTGTGTITSLGVGSGLDLNGLLDQLQQEENQKLTPITTQETSYQTKISAFGTLQSALAGFQDAAHALTDSATFQPVQSTVVGDALTATTTSDTPPGDYQIQVTQRAQASSVATLGVANSDTNLGGGAIQFTFANGNTLSVTVNGGQSSIANIRDAINAQNGGVSASLINDGSGTPYRLVLRASTTGTAAGISNVQFSGALANGLKLDSATQQSAQDAKLSINGIDIQSSSNTIEDAIQGVTLNLNDSGTATLQVTRDNSTIEGSVKNLVDSYNGMVQVLSGLTGYDASTQTGGVLLGDSTARAVQSQISRVLGGAVSNGGSYKTLSDLGITLQVDGTLSLDSSTLDQAVSTNLSGVMQFFNGKANGMANQLDQGVTNMTETGGLISSATDGLNASLKQLGQQYTDMQSSIATTMANYRTQFTQLDTLIAQMNSTSTYLTQQFDALSKMTLNNKS